MANFKSATYIAQETAGEKSASMISTAALISGKIQFLQCEFTVPAGTANLDTFELCFLPAGVTVVPGLITTTTDTVCGANGFDLGVPGASDAIATGVTLNTVGTAVLNSEISSFYNPVRQALVATIDGALTEGGKFYLNIPLVNSN